MFSICTSLENIVIPNTVPSIGDYVFQNFKKLIPLNVETLDIVVFYKCSGVKIYCEATSKPEGWKSEFFQKCIVYWEDEWKYL